MLGLSNTYRIVCVLLVLACGPCSLYGESAIEKKMPVEKVGRSRIAKGKLPKKLSYYLYIADFVNSSIQIPTAAIFDPSSTISSKYLAGRAPVYDKHNKKVGTCSASFLCMQNSDGIYTDISNYLSVDSGLIVSWFTPTTLINLEVDSIVRSMVTKCRVAASTKIGFNPYYKKTFSMIVSSDGTKIHFRLRECKKR